MRAGLSWLLVVVLGSVGSIATAADGSRRVEHVDAAETVPPRDAHGTPAIDIERVVIDSDGRSVSVTLHLSEALVRTLRAVDSGGGFGSDLAWIYFDIDHDETSGGFAVPGTLGGFEYEARVVASIDREVSALYALDRFEQNETSFAMDLRFSMMDAEARDRRQRGWQQSKSRIQIHGAVVTIDIPYELLDTAAGETIRVRLREYHHGPQVLEQFLPDAVLELAR